MHEKITRDKVVEPISKTDEQFKASGASSNDMKKVFKESMFQPESLIVWVIRCTSLGKQFLDWLRMTTGTHYTKTSRHQKESLV